MTTAQGPTGTYRPCPVCHAPIVDPFPPAWEIEMVKEGPPQGPVKSFITPHRDDCDAPYADPQPGLALRLPGTTVASLSFQLPPPVTTADPLGLRYADRQHLAQDPTIPVNLGPVEQDPVPPANYAASQAWSASGWAYLGTTEEGYRWTADDVEEGRAVSFAGPGRLFVKPYVSSDLDAVLGGGVIDVEGGVPILDAIADAADSRPDEP